MKKLYLQLHKSELHYQLCEIGLMVIGRDSRCDIALNYPNISRKHCQLMVSTLGSFVEVSDLNSQNGILVNDKLVKKQVMYPGDVLQIGNIKLKLLELSTPPVQVIQFQPKKVSDSIQNVEEYDMIGTETGQFGRFEKFSTEPKLLGENGEIIEEPDNLDFELTNPLPNLSLEKFYEDNLDEFADVRRTEILPRYSFEESIDPMIDQVIADYKLVELLDVTYYWKEYKAVHVLFNTNSILRIISDNYAIDPAFENRFHREAKVSIKLSHQNIISLATSGKFNNRYYFIRDFIETVRLEELVNKKGRLKSEIVIVIAKQITSALIYAHKNNVIHRNINPSNILLDKNGKVYLYDFGFSTILGHQSTGQTLSGGSIDPRSLIYRAPELFSQTPYADQQSDIYSFCAVLFFAISGFPPFASSIDVLKRETPHLPSNLPDISEDLAKIIHRGLDKNPFKRFGSAEELFKALENIKK